MLEKDGEGTITGAELLGINVSLVGVGMKIEVKRKFIFWYWVLKAANGQVLGTSETYYSYNNAMRAAQTLSRAIKVKVV